MSERPKPNIGNDLVRIHKVITRGLTVAQENCQRFVEDGFPDGATQEGFWKFCQALEAQALGHHRTEDDLFFPFIEERLPETDFEKLKAEHQTMHAVLDDMRAARESGSLSELNDALTRMSSMWNRHIVEEESVFSPQIAAEIMTIPEHIDLAQKAAAHSQEHAQPAPLTVPFLLYNLEAEDRAHFEAVLPQEVIQQLVPVVWKKQWAPMKPFFLD